MHIAYAPQHLGGGDGRSAEPRKERRRRGGGETARQPKGMYLVVVFEEQVPTNPTNRPTPSLGRRTRRRWERVSRDAAAPEQSLGRISMSRKRPRHGVVDDRTRRSSISHSTDAWGGRQRPSTRLKAGGSSSFVDERGTREGTGAKMGLEGKQRIAFPSCKCRARIWSQAGCVSAGVTRSWSRIGAPRAPGKREPLSLFTPSCTAAVGSLFPPEYRDTDTWNRRGFPRDAKLSAEGVFTRVGHVHEAVLILLLLVEHRHECRRRRDRVVHKDENRLL